MDRYAISDLCIALSLFFVLLACGSCAMAARADGLSLQAFDTGPSVYWDRALTALAFAALLFTVAFIAVKDTLH